MKKIKSGRIIIISIVLVLSVVLGGMSGILIGFIRESSKPMNLSNAVTDAFCDVIEDENGNYCYHIPEITVDSDAVEDINKRMYASLYDEYSEKVLASIDEWGMPSISEMTYRWGYKDNTVSITVQTLDNMAFYPFFYVFNVDVRSGEELTDEEVFELFSLHKEDFYEKVRTAVKQYSVREKTKYPIDEQENYINGIIERTLTDEYIKQAKPFIDSDGKLCAVVSLFSPGGADTYLHMISLDTGLDKGYITCDGKHDEISD
ncbi:MAG: hypothetical protein IKL47_14395 [Clostridia bacterium]|nr:hypothetical protein [Clostridia bacterium]